MERKYLDVDLLASPFFETPTDHDKEDESSGRKEVLTRHISTIISYFTNSSLAFGRQSMLLEQMVFYSTPSGILIWASPKAISTLLYSKSEILQMNFVDLIHADDKLNFLDYMGQNISTKFSNNSVIFRFLTAEKNAILMELRSMFAERGNDSVIVSYAREYTLNVATALDGVLDARLENLRLRIELAKALMQNGLDPKQNPYLCESANDPGLSLELPADNVIDMHTEKRKSFYCRQCGATESPEWRKGPEGKKT
jgi:hypothetical protein